MTPKESKSNKDDTEDVKFSEEDKERKQEPEIIYEDNLNGTNEKKSRKGLVSIIILLLLIGLLAFNWNGLFSKEDTMNEDLVLVTVNGVDITQSEVDQMYDGLPDYYKQSLTKEDILNQTIDKILIESKIQKTDIDISDETVDGAIEELLVQSMMSMEQFEEYIATQNMTLEDVRKQVRQNLKTEKYLEENVFIDLEVSEQDVEAFYETNLDLFNVPERRNVSHILICFDGKANCQDNKSREEARELILNISEMAKEESFAELAKEYSEGPSAVSGGNLGLVEENSNFVEEFKSAALELPEGEVSGVVETDFGFHLILVNEIIPSKTMELDEAEAQIKTYFEQEMKNSALEAFLLQLRENATIIYANENICTDGEVIFYTADWCKPCKEEETIVNELIDEGYDITIVSASEDDLVKRCYEDEMKEDIPQFICKGKSKVGQLNKEEIIKFAESCS